MSEMTRSDRETLIKIARQRERLAKSEAKERAARLLADFEKQLDRRYSYDENKIWAEASGIAKTTVADANKKIATECGRLGIPTQFAPKLVLDWYDRGRNSLKSERAEMRHIAEREINAIDKAARTTIERQSLATQEMIMIGGLTTEDARLFLEQMPTAEALMPAISVDRAEALLLREKKTSADSH